MWSLMYRQEGNHTGRQQNRKEHNDEKMAKYFDGMFTDVYVDRLCCGAGE